jgi:nicotinate-nucleotide pyrophosphorylase (carboxylating)
MSAAISRDPSSPVTRESVLPRDQVNQRQGPAAARDLAAVIQDALAEDIGDGDVTTLNTIPVDAMLQGVFLAKEAGVVAGLEVVCQVFAQLDAAVTLEFGIADGERVEPRQIFGTIRGPGRALLTGERVALNFLQRMSGIATLTRRYVDAVAGTRAVILDTRKTAPGLRALDKWAVRLGGGQNHRIGLYDMAMIKDNHIAAVGGIAEAVQRIRAGDPLGRPIEVEVTTLAQLAEALAQPIDRILLDNMSLQQMAEAVRIAAGRIPLEASGNVSLDTVAAIAATGVDYISSGALTHSVRALDISLDIASNP